MAFVMNVFSVLLIYALSCIVSAPSLYAKGNVGAAITALFKPKEKSEASSVTITTTTDGKDAASTNPDKLKIKVCMSKALGGNGCLTQGRFDALQAVVDGFKAKGLDTQPLRKILEPSAEPSAEKPSLNVIQFDIAHKRFHGNDEQALINEYHRSLDELFLKNDSDGIESEPVVMDHKKKKSVFKRLLSLKKTPETNFGHLLDESNKLWQKFVKRAKKLNDKNLSKMSDYSALFGSDSKNENSWDNDSVNQESAVLLNKNEEHLKMVTNYFRILIFLYTPDKSREELESLAKKLQNIPLNSTEFTELAQEAEIAEKEYILNLAQKKWTLSTSDFTKLKEMLASVGSQKLPQMSEFLSQFKWTGTTNFQGLLANANDYLVKTFDYSGRKLLIASMMKELKKDFPDLKITKSFARALTVIHEKAFLLFSRNNSNVAMPKLMESVENTVRVISQNDPSFETNSALAIDVRTKLIDAALTTETDDNGSSIENRYETLNDTQIKNIQSALSNIQKHIKSGVQGIAASFLLSNWLDNPTQKSMKPERINVSLSSLENLIKLIPPSTTKAYKQLIIDMADPSLFDEYPNLMIQLSKDFIFFAENQVLPSDIAMFRELLEFYKKDEKNALKVTNAFSKARDVLDSSMSLDNDGTTSDMANNQKDGMSNESDYSWDHKKSVSKNWLSNKIKVLNKKIFRPIRKTIGIVSQKRIKRAEEILFLLFKDIQKGDGQENIKILPSAEATLVGSDNHYTPEAQVISAEPMKRSQSGNNDAEADRDGDIPHAVPSLDQDDDSMLRRNPEKDSSKERDNWESDEGSEVQHAVPLPEDVMSQKIELEDQSAKNNSAKKKKRKNSKKKSKKEEQFNDDVSEKNRKFDQQYSNAEPYYQHDGLAAQ